MFTSLTVTAGTAREQPIYRNPSARQANPMQKCLVCGRKIWRGKHRYCKPKGQGGADIREQTERNRDILGQVIGGSTYTAVASVYGISRERVRQLVAKELTKP